MEMLKKNGVQFLYPDKVPFQVKSKPVMENLMKDPKMKAIIDKINAN